MTKILDVLRTPSAMLVALVLALLAQLEHTAQVFSMVVQASGWSAQLHAYAFAIAVETAVLLFVLAGHKRISFGFALATFATNLSYYAMHDIALLNVSGVPAWLMALLLPCCIVGYSHIIAEAPHNAPQDATANTTTTPVAPPRPATPRSEATGEATEPNKLTPTQRRAHIAEQELFDPAKVAAQFGVSVRTAQADIAQVRTATTHANGAARHE